MANNRDSFDVAFKTMLGLWVVGVAISISIPIVLLYWLYKTLQHFGIL